ncbi:MAG: hypothetical protein U9N87_12615, partial [Planctomycetota bacterium]|nr:hypothetical protein [Planctomycetota bacterium]
MMFRTPACPRSVFTHIVLPVVFAAIVFFASQSRSAEPAVDLYVSPLGSDQWSGRLSDPNGDKSDGPLATIHKAQEAVRALRKTRPEAKRPIVVAVRGGMYELERPITFGPQDSGTEKSPVVYRAHAQERPVLSGGRTVRGWKVDDLGRWHVRL